MTVDVRYAKSGDVSIAYAVSGTGPVDLVMVPGFVSHLEIFDENPRVARFSERFSRFSRFITFDKRGTGMSDPVAEVATLEQRMDDVRAVMDAAGSERAVLMGVSEGAQMCILFAATYPERVTSMILYGGMARSTWAPDYPFANTREAILESVSEFMAPAWGTGDNIDVFAPSAADDPVLRAWWGKLQRNAASPSMMARIFEMFLNLDVREALPLVRCPTLVLHRKGDRVVNVNAGRWMAERIPGARFVELPGRDHSGFVGDVDRLIDEVEEFVTGTRSVPEDVDRILATVMFVDIVGSTERAAALGDERWRELLESFQGVYRRELERHRGVEVKSMGDGFLARFDGPARAIRAGRHLIDATRDLGIEIRTGLHSGECEVMGNDLGGIAVHIASRVVDKAGAGEVLVSSTVHDLVAGSGIEFEDRGAQALKGVPGEWHLFAARSQGAG